MTVKKLFTRLALGVLLAAAVGLAGMAQTAEAITVKLQNPYGEKLSVALVYYDDSARNWFVRGWYLVDPYTTRTVNLNNSTRSEKIWIHAHNQEASWGGDSQYGKRYTVINEAFKYVAGKQSCPNGSGRRQVGFDRWIANNAGFVNYRP